VFTHLLSWRHGFDLITRFFKNKSPGVVEIFFKTHLDLLCSKTHLYMFNLIKYCEYIKWTLNLIFHLDRYLKMVLLVGHIGDQ